MDWRRGDWEDEKMAHNVAVDFIYYIFFISRSAHPHRGEGPWWEGAAVKDHLNVFGGRAAVRILGKG
jgi:hypothetical protein